MQKHAYLILAHKDDSCFRTLLQMLDDKRNDIFIHMDLKCHPYNIEEVTKCVKYSHLYHVQRLDIAWGGWKMIEAELALLKKAVLTRNYQYYHLISGQDLPIKSQNFIHNFFDKNNGKEYVRFNSPDFRYSDRVQIFHLFQEKLGRKKNMFLNRIFIEIQKMIGIKRNKGISFFKGTQWFSITNGFAKYVVDEEKWIKHIFKFTYCCDEVFLQTLLMRSPFKDNRYWLPMDNDTHAIMRLIDWNRGTPYVFKISDKDEIMSSEMLFCRKFDSVIDSDIITYVKATFSHSSQETER